MSQSQLQPENVKSIDYNETEEFVIRESIINEKDDKQDEDISLFVDMMYHR